MREVHLGSRLTEGVVRWWARTQEAALALITRQAADAAATSLDHSYLTRSLARTEQHAGVPVPGDDHVRRLAAGLTEDQQTAILDHFLGAGQRTTGGILQAVTSAAQTRDDTAYDMERAGLRAMTLAATTSTIPERRTGAHPSIRPAPRLTWPWAVALSGVGFFTTPTNAAWAKCADPDPDPDPDRGRRPLSPATEQQF